MRVRCCMLVSTLHTVSRSSPCIVRVIFDAPFVQANAATLHTRNPCIRRLYAADPCPTSDGDASLTNHKARIKWGPTIVHAVEIADLLHPSHSTDGSLHAMGRRFGSSYSRHILNKRHLPWRTGQQCYGTFDSGAALQMPDG